MNFGSPSDTFLPRIPQIQRLAEENFQKVFMEAQEAITDRSRDSWTDLFWLMVVNCGFLCISGIDSGVCLYLATSTSLLRRPNCKHRLPTRISYKTVAWSQLSQVKSSHWTNYCMCVLFSKSLRCAKVTYKKWNVVFRRPRVHDTVSWWRRPVPILGFDRIWSLDSVGSIG